MTLRDIEEVQDERFFGGKAIELGAARRANLPVPEGIAISYEYVEQVVNGQGHGSELVERVEALAGPYVVRSSSVGEDSDDASFAGQHRTVINVRDSAGVLDALERVYASGQSDEAMIYRSELGINEPPKMGAVVQNLIDADKAGVLFSQNPVTGDDERVIEASWGFGEAVVDSMVTPDYVRMDSDGEILERRIGTKKEMVVPSNDGGTEIVSVPDGMREELCLNDAELGALVNLAERCDSYRSGGHDIEWAFADEELYLLQRRAITTI